MAADVRDIDPAEVSQPPDWRNTMSTAQLPVGLLERLTEIRAKCPEIRLGQFLATVGLLAEDETGRSLWDVEDAEFAAALERFANDLVRRES
jgi:hypothetical protein